MLKIGVNLVLEAETVGPRQSLGGFTTFEMHEMVPLLHEYKQLTESFVKRWLLKV